MMNSTLKGASSASTGTRRTIGSMNRNPFTALRRGASAAPSTLARRAFPGSGPRVFATAAMPATKTPASTYTPPKELYNFELVKTEFLVEYDSLAMLYRHKKTGTEVMSLVNKDENKTFGVVLRTPPANSTGIPHILEHSVLCGSRKYPIKEPFVELMKGSLNTFLNAFTYPDRTCYPVASTNLQDFYNLVDVYMDAVFFPKCVQDEMTFQQEGWHFELDDKEAPLTFKGVVFNEMKGVYSSPDSVLYREIQQSLFPDNTYGVDSGGDPVVIPQLTFAEFRDFHQRFYHPSNARIWFYGDDEPEARLRMMDEYLSLFDKRQVDSAVRSQSLFPAPKKVVKYYAAGGAGEEEGGGEEPKTYVAVNWVLTESEMDLETELALGFLDYLLVGTSAAPLRKALMDSGLGEALVGGGLEGELLQPTYSVGLKGVDPAKADLIEPLVLAKLQELATQGFSQSQVEAAINTIEFSLRENNTGRFPRGLSLMLRSVTSWLYDRDPFRPLKWQADLAAFKARLAAGEDVFAPLIRKFLLENKHRVTVELRPDTALAAQMEAEEKGKLDAKRGSMSAKEIEELIETTRALKERQETPDAPEALKCIPGLALADIPKKAASIPTALAAEQGASILRHDLFTNDVLYMDAALDLTRVPARLLPLVPLFCRCLTNTGTAKESFTELTERIGRKTGGISATHFTSAVRGKKEPVSYVMLKGKAMKDRTGDLMEIMSDVLLTANLGNKERIKQMVLETKASMESAVVGAGHSIAASRLDAQRSIAGAVSEQMGGLAYLEFLRKLAKRIDTDFDGVHAELEEIRRALLGREGALINLTGDEKLLTAAAPHVSSLLGALPGAGGARQDWSSLIMPRVNEALTVPTQVNYVGKAANLYEEGGYELSGSAYVISKQIGTSWLWDRVRVSGGAYGGFCDFDSHSGMFTFLSYRDPNLTSTVENYDGTVEFLRTLELDQDALTKAIIGTIGDIDGYQLPDAKGSTAFMRHILGVSDEERQRRREEVLSTSVQDFKKFADYLECTKGPEARVVAVTSADLAEQVQKERPGFFDKIQKVL